jgi:hypothetical protein
LEIAHIVERYVLGVFPVNDLPAVAMKALDAGFDSPSLPQLAGSQGADSDDIKRLFHKILSELDIKMPSQVEAGLSMACDIARDILKGAITPYEGAKQIWWDIYTRFPQLTELRGFVGFASEYEDDDRHRQEYSRLIVEECKELLGVE